MSSVIKRRKPAKAPFTSSFLDEARKLGLVGAMSGPRDLSENRAHYLKEALQNRHGRSR
jgi:hypothetical protein